LNLKNKPGRTSASTVLADIMKKASWNLGTKGTILQGLTASSVPLLHKTMSLLELKEKVRAILVDRGTGRRKRHP
jgi:hypothetical protein